MTEMLESLRKQNAEQAAQLQKLLEQNRVLKQKVQFLLQRLFGRASEKIDARQLELMLGLQADASVSIPMEPKPVLKLTGPRHRREHKPRLPEDLPTEEVVIEPEAVKEHPEAFRCIGREVTQELDYVPPKYFRRLLIRPKYVSRTDRALAPILASLPPRLIEGGYGSSGLVTDIILKKYVDHIPLHRQEQILRTRFGIELSRKTMSDWVRIVAEWLGPVYREVAAELRRSGYLQVDETPIRYVPADGRGSGQGYFWVYYHPRSKTVLYEWHTGRGAECLDKMLKDFAGTIQTDGYQAYQSYAKRHPDIILAGCWAHVRRKFFEAKDEAPSLAAWFLKQIGHLYRIEADLRRLRMGAAGRQAVRAAEAGMVLARLHKALRRKATTHLPQSRMGQAIAYALSRWPELLKYRDDGRLEIDNNGVENAIRPTALGKKNWLFIGHPEAGDRSAIIYTLLENCRRNGINPEEYLRDVLERLPAMKIQDVGGLTPARWAARRKVRVA